MAIDQRVDKRMCVLPEHLSCLPAHRTEGQLEYQSMARLFGGFDSYLSDASRLGNPVPLAGKFVHQQHQKTQSEPGRYNPSGIPQYPLLGTLQRPQQFADPPKR